MHTWALLELGLPLSLALLRLSQGNKGLKCVCLQYCVGATIATQSYCVTHAPDASCLSILSGWAQDMFKPLFRMPCRNFGRAKEGIEECSPQRQIRAPFSYTYSQLIFKFSWQWGS